MLWLASLMQLNSRELGEIFIFYLTKRINNVYN